MITVGVRYGLKGQFALFHCAVQNDVLALRNGTAQAAHVGEIACRASAGSASRMYGTFMRVVVKQNK